MPGHCLLTSNHTPLPPYTPPPPLCSQLGWESVFLTFGSLGFLWLVLWRGLPNGPTSTSSACASEVGGDAPAAAAAATATAKPPLRLQDVPWGAFAASPAFWAIVAAQVSVTIGNTLAFRCAD